jgi:hypothetical protein
MTQSYLFRVHAAVKPKMTEVVAGDIATSYVLYQAILLFKYLFFLFVQAEGRLNPSQAFMQGKLAARGNVTLMQKLQPLMGDKAKL